MKLRIIAALIFINLLTFADESGVQVKTFIDTFMVNEETHANVLVQKEKLWSEIDSHVVAYQNLWDIKEKIDFKCSSGIESLPNYSSVTPNTELGILIQRKCEKYSKLRSTLTSLQNNSDVIRGILKKFDVTIEKAIDGTDAVVLIKEEKIDVNSIEKRLMKDGEVINGMTESDKEILKDLPKDKEKLEKQISENVDSGCSVYAKTCPHLPNWPDEDTPIGGVTCNDLRKSEGQSWETRYNFYCKGGKVYLKSEKYQYIKRMRCEIGKKPIAKGSTVFQKRSLGSYEAYTCIGGIGVNIGSLRFKPVKCDEHGKNVGDEWYTFGESQDYPCRGICYAGKKESKQRAIEYLWRCDQFGHIVPSQPGGKRSFAGGQFIKNVKVDAQLFKQTIRRSKFLGESCQKATREVVREIRCDLSQKENVKCPRTFPNAMTMEERDMIDDMMYGIPSALCREKIVFKGKNECGAKGTKYLKCENNCRTACEPEKSNEMSASNFKIMNYYPNAQRTSSTKRVK